MGAGNSRTTSHANRLREDLFAGFCSWTPFPNSPGTLVCLPLAVRSHLGSTHLAITYSEQGTKANLNTSIPSSSINSPVYCHFDQESHSTLRPSGVITLRFATVITSGDHTSPRSDVRGSILLPLLHLALAICSFLAGNNTSSRAPIM